MSGMQGIRKGKAKDYYKAFALNNQAVGVAFYLDDKC